MKILHYLHGRCSLESPHGVDKTVYYLSRSLAAAGARTGVFCLSDKPVKPIPGVDVRNFPAPRNPFALGPELRDAIVRWQPDFLHFHSSYQISNQPVARLARSLGIPYAVTAHGNLSLRLLKRKFLLKFPYKHLFEMPFFNRAAFVHAIADMDDIRAYGITTPMVVAPNGFDLEDLPSPLDPALARAEFPAIDGKDLILFLGRLDTRQKGLDTVLEAFVQVRAEHPKAHLALAGPDWKGSLGQLRERARQLGIAADVTFCGTVPGPAKFHLMKASRLFLHPSRWEAGIPFSVLEALATGTPCVLSPAADPYGLVPARGAGLATGADAGTLAAAILAVLRLPADEHLAMSGKARQLIADEFRWEKPARTLLDAYQQYSNARPEPSPVP
jgi:glycosyltransferase involved in cell wall biosynthesis